jgi:hypothetical protein
METDHKAIFEQLKADIEKRREQLRECLKDQQRLNKEISSLEQSAVGLATMLGEEYTPEDDLSLTEAIVKTFVEGGDYSVVEMKAKLEARGYDTRRHTNVLASIHSIFKRLIEQDKIKHNGHRGGKPVHRATAKLVPPPPQPEY